jgi:hypothetical protein
MAATISLGSPLPHYPHCLRKAHQKATLVNFDILQGRPECNPLSEKPEKSRTNRFSSAT